MVCSTGTVAGAHGSVLHCHVVHCHVAYNLFGHQLLLISCTDVNMEQCVRYRAISQAAGKSVGVIDEELKHSQ